MNIREDDLKNAIEDALNYLPRLKGKPPMSDVLKMYFGLSPYTKEYTEEEIAQKYNTFKQEISQIKKKAIRELINNPRTKDLKQFLG
jgi:DNA-directed RNA polymerase sigma subunit (sigma70/sigma32)